MKRPVDSDTPGLVNNRACRNCVKIKVKCLPSEGSGENICRRCQRLGKVCSTPAPAPRKQRAKSTRVTQLEERVEQLSALLAPTTLSPGHSRTTGSASNSPALTSHAQQSVSDESATTQAKNNNIIEAEHADLNDFAPAQGDATEPGGCRWSRGIQPIARSGSPCLFLPNIPGRKDGSQLLSEPFSPIFLDSELESRLFDDFRRRMMEHFPFVLVPEDMSAEDFQRSKPFTYWACIYAASHRDRRLSQTLHDEMMKAAGYRTFSAGGKSIDLLQGTLLLTAWTHNVTHYSPQIMNLLHLAQALMADMGLLRAIRVQDKIRIASDMTAFLHGHASTAVVLGDDEKRALLGCFCLTAKASLTFNRIDPMRYSSHIGACCESLIASSQPPPSDLLAVNLVQLYRIVGKYSQIESRPAQFYGTMFLDEIAQYRQHIPSVIKDNRMLELEILTASLSVLEPSYTTDCQDKLDQLSALHSCIEVGNKVVEAMLDFPNETWTETTTFGTMSLAQLLIVFARISFFKSNSWEMSYARRNVRLDLVLQRIEDKLNKVQEVEVARYPNNRIWRCATQARKALHIRNWYDAKVAAEERATAVTMEPPMEVMMPNTMSENMFGNFDDSLWEDMMMGNWSDFVM